MSFDLMVRVRQLEPDRIEADWPTSDLEPQDEADLRAEAYRAKYLSADPGQRLNFPSRAMGVLLAALELADAVYGASASAHRGHPADGEAALRDDEGRVPSYKLTSNDGWHLTASECQLIAARLAVALEQGLRFEARGFSYDLRADAADAADRETFAWLERVRQLFAAAAAQHGLEVW